MSFQLLSRKVSTAREILNEWQLQSLESGFVAMTNKMDVSRSASRANRGYLFIETLFALIRHREWLDVPVFRALVIEFLQLDHGISRDPATRLVKQMIDDFSRMNLTRSRTLCSDDREFLTYAYVVAASAANDIEMELDLGLGHALVRKLRDGVRVLEEARVDIFIPEYDAMLASIIVELGHQMRTRPWVLDEHRLKYRLLSDLSDNAMPWILEERIPGALESLAAIGLDQTYSETSEDLLHAFERSRLIAPERDGRGRIRYWDVTTDGARLTTSIVRLQHGRRLVDNISEFLALNLSWQIGILRDKEIAPLALIMDLLSGHLSRMAPMAVEAAVERIVELGPDLLEPDTLRSLLKSAQLPWHKAAVLRALRDTTPSDELANIVADALSHEASGSMVEAAGVLLDRWAVSQSF